MDTPREPHYRASLALVHHRGFGFHADNCADDILEILEPVLSYLADEAAIERAIARIGQALRPDGILAVDVCDLRWGEARRDQPHFATVEDDWALFTRYAQPTPTTYVREITTFVRDATGCWSRDDERHVNVLIETDWWPCGP